MISIDRLNKKIEVNVPTATEAIIKYDDTTVELVLHDGYGFVTGLEIENAGTIIVKAIIIIEENTNNND